MRKGLTETEVAAALGDLGQANLSPPTVAALRIADLLTENHPLVDQATYEELRRHLDPGEILEVAAAVAVGSGWQRLIEAFGIRPDQWTEATPLAWSPADAT